MSPIQEDEVSETREPQAMRDQVIWAVAEAFRKFDDPGVSDLDDEQPMSIHLPLGVLRAARSVQHSAREAYLRSRFDDQYEVPEASPPERKQAMTLRVALEACERGPLMPPPDPGAHSWRAWGEFWRNHWLKCRDTASAALAQASPPGSEGGGSR